MIVAGFEPPAMSVMYADPRGGFSGFSVIFADVDPDESGDETPTVGCLHCLLEDGDAQLGRGLDLARERRAGRLRPGIGGVVRPGSVTPSATDHLGPRSPGTKASAVAAARVAAWAEGS